MFVKALRKVIAQRGKLMNGTGPRDAELHRRLAMRIFLASGSKRRFKKIVLLTLVNSDWRNQEDIGLPRARGHLAGSEEEAQGWPRVRLVWG